MSFLKGLKIVWLDPDICKTATRKATKKWRRENEEYLNEPGTVTVDGELFKN